jgi:hypothetical protein
MAHGKRAYRWLPGRLEPFLSRQVRIGRDHLIEVQAKCIRRGCLAVKRGAVVVCPAMCLNDLSSYDGEYPTFRV